MAGRADFHGPFGDVHVGQLEKLVIHAGQLALHVFGGLVRDVEERAAVLGAAALAHFGVDGAGNHVAGGELQLLGVVALHEALAIFVAEDAAFAAHRFGDQNALHARRPHHAGGMKLHELHVHQLGARVVGERHAVAGVLPGVRGDLPGLADAAGADDDGLGLEDDEAALLAPVAEGAGDAVAIFEQPRDGALHVDVDAQMHAAVLQGADHLEAGAVADVAEPFEGVAAKGPLQNLAVLGAVEERAPLLQFAHALGGLLGVELGHAPVVQEFSAAHGVAEVRAPVVGRIHVGHGRGDAAFGHHRVRFAEQRLAHDADAHSLGQGFNCGAQARAACADDEHVVFVGFVFGGHRSRMSLRRPAETMRT